MTTNQKEITLRDAADGQVANGGLRHAATHHSPPTPPAPGKSVLVAALVVVATSAIWVVYHRVRSHTTTAAGAATARGQLWPVPVASGVVSTRDVPIYLDGLGTAQAFNTVTVHTRVDGQLVKVSRCKPDHSFVRIVAATAWSGTRAVPPLRPRFVARPRKARRWELRRSSFSRRSASGNAPGGGRRRRCVAR